MFDGSHRTNKREINLAGKSASSRSSRASHLNQARQQRLARAQAKAKLNAARVLQRCWRGVRAGVSGGLGDGESGAVASRAVDSDGGAGAGGMNCVSRGRKGISMELDARFRVIFNNFNSLLQDENNTTVSPEQQKLLPAAASLLAFRLSPPLIPFYSSNHVNKPTDKKTPSRSKKWDSNDHRAEDCMRADLLLIESLLARVSESNGSNVQVSQIISPTAAQKIVSITIILLRQSFYFQSISSTSKSPFVSNEQRKAEDHRLVKLLNYLLGSHPFDCFVRENDSLWSNRPSDYFVNVIRRRNSDGDVVNEGNGTLTSPLHGGDPLVGGNAASISDSAKGSGLATTSKSGGWTINLFHCLRDCLLLQSKMRRKNYSGDCEGGGATPMDIDDHVHGDNLARSRREEGEMLELLLKWCCRTILYLATLENDTGNALKQQPSPTALQLPDYQQGLALLGSVLFASNELLETLSNQSLLNRQINHCLSSLDQHLKGSRNNVTMQIADLNGISSSSSLWSPVLTYHLSHTVSRLQTTHIGSHSPTSASAINTANHKVPGLMKEFYQTSSPILKPDVAAKSSGSSADSRGYYPWMEALRETMSSRECLILNSVLLSARAKQKESIKHQHLFEFAVPVILDYALQHQQDFAVLSSFVARGENIKSWLTTGSANAKSVDLTTKTAVAATYEGGASEEESDDDADDVVMQEPHPAQVTVVTSSRRDNTSTGRYSRADLLTLPKLDDLYQTNCLRTRKNAVDGLRKNSKDEAHLFVSVAEIVGKGDWMQSLGNSLFQSRISTQAFSTSPQSAVLVPPPSPSLQEHAISAYIDALSSLMTACSGLKAGRNAASPLLAKIAFNGPLVTCLWEFSNSKSILLTSASSSADAQTITSAYEVLSAFCDIFSHQLLAVNDDEFLNKYAPETNSAAGIIDAKTIVVFLKNVLNDLYWVRPVLASDINSSSSAGIADSESNIRLQKARLILSATKLWNSLYERWCRLYRVKQFCEEECWVFPQLASRGQHDNNPVIRSQVTTLADNSDNDDDSMGENSVSSNDVGGRSAGGIVNDAGSDALASSFRDPKMARVLTCIPQALPFSRRVNLFQSLLDMDKLRTQDETAAFNQMMMNLHNSEVEGVDFSGREKVTIRRDAMYSDSMNSLNRLGKKLRKKVQVTFVNQHGTTEAGIDGGGVFKEFLDDLITDAFLPKTVNGESEDIVQTTGGREIDFFTVTPLQTLQVNVTTDDEDDVLPHYEFLGRVLGKAIYESILVEPQFCLPFLNKLLGKQNSLDDLKNLDPEYYKNLRSLRYMSAADIDSLGLSFEMTKSSQPNGSHGAVELVPGGSNISVTKENVIQYIHLVSHNRMNIAGARQTHAFLRGFRDLIPAPWVRLFSAYEFQKLISGDDAIKGIDVKGMAAAMRYSGGFHPSQPIIHWLWEVIAEFNPEQQRKFLKFMTSCSRQPLLGFQSLVPAPCIQQVRLREDDQGNDIAEGAGFGNIRLPTSSTCMNLLKLPKYSTKEMLREKLIYAIESAAGFELS